MGVTTRPGRMRRAARRALSFVIGLVFLAMALSASGWRPATAPAGPVEVRAAVSSGTDTVHIGRSGVLADGSGGPASAKAPDGARAAGSTARGRTTVLQAQPPVPWPQPAAGQPSAARPSGALPGVEAAAVDQVARSTAGERAPPSRTV